MCENKISVALKRILPAFHFCIRLTVKLTTVPSEYLAVHETSVLLAATSHCSLSTCVTSLINCHSVIISLHVSDSWFTGSNICFGKNV